MPSVAPTPGDVTELAPTALRELLDAGEALTVLDVRERHERAYCAISVPSTAVDLFIPMRDIPSSLDVIQEALARGPLVVYCHHGVRSSSVAGWLAERGMRGLKNLQGGIDAWSREVDATVPRYH